MSEVVECVENRMNEMRSFDTGAVRDTLDGKLSYMRALSPEVLRRYVEYLDRHRTCADGTLRDFDNWKKGIPLDVYADSLLRHTFDVWQFVLGNEPSEMTTLDDLLCAVIFNASGMLFELSVEDNGGHREEIKL